MGAARCLSGRLGSHLAVLGLALGTAALLPGYIVERARPAAHPDVRLEESEPPGAVALFALRCEDGIVTPACLRELEQLTRTLESDARVVGPVRSLARAVAVRADASTLRAAPLQLEPLLAAPPRDDAELHRLRARLRDDPALAARFVRADGRATFVVATLEPELSEQRAGQLVEAVRSRFDQPPRLHVDARLDLAPGEQHWIASLGGTALGVACLAAVVALTGARLAAAASLAGVAALLWFHAALAASSALHGAGSDAAPALALAGGVCAALPLLQRARVELRRGASLARAVAGGLAFASPPTLLALLAFGAGGAAPALLVALAAALVAGLLAAAALVPLVRGGGFTRPLDPWLERGLLRLDVASRSQRRALCTLVLALAVAALAGVANRPGEGARPGVPRSQRWVVDSRAAGGALEPAFLERVEALRRELATRPGVSGASSLVDAVLAPAQRAAHDGEAAFAGVPPTRADVEVQLALFAAAAPAELEGRIDGERRRVAIDARVEPVAAVHVERLLLALAVILALCALGLRSPAGGAIALAPAALAALVVSGARAPLEVALLAAVGAATSSLLVLARTRDLAQSGAEHSVALSLALRDAGRSSAALALAASGIAAFAAPASVAALLVASVLGLALTPLLARALGAPRFARVEPLRADVSRAVGALQRRGTDARR